MTIHKVTDVRQAMALMVKAYDELAATMTKIEERHGTEFARGVHLALACSVALPAGATEPLDTRLVCSALCKRLGLPDPFHEALAEGRALQSDVEA